MKFYVYRLALKNKFRGLLAREGLLVQGSAGWAEVSPFWDYDDVVSSRWLLAGVEAATVGYPAPKRTSIEVNETIPAVAPQLAHELAVASSCKTFKVKIAERGQQLADDLARLEAVRAAVPHAKIRVDANAAWDADHAKRVIPQLDRAAGGLEYVEQPCRTVEELAQVRRAVGVRIAADESIRLAADPMEVVRHEAADLAVIKNQPLGGVRATLELADRLGIPLVVSSALESSVGLRAGLACAGALDELPYACGLATSRLFVRDVTARPLRPVAGRIEIRDVVPEHTEPVPEQSVSKWRDRLARMWQAAGEALAEKSYEFVGALPDNIGMSESVQA